MTDDLFAGKPWDTLIIFKELSEQLKQKYPLPAYTTRIATATSEYENFIRVRWEEFKLNPTEANAEKFIKAVIKYVQDNWQLYMADILGVDSNDLTQAQLDMLKSKVDEHIGYLSTSLLPDLIKAVRDGLDDFSKFDYRAIFLYAGALWSFGFLASVTFDGLQPRDAGDLFIFLGPDDENTCTGPRGCKQHVGKTYILAEIISGIIIPGYFRCLTSCRHILIPIVSM
jgi:hypothetical protein